MHRQQEKIKLYYKQQLTILVCLNLPPRILYIKLLQMWFVDCVNNFALS